MQPISCVGHTAPAQEIHAPFASRGHFAMQ